jgi:precorrin-3B C17-methyltransferase
VLAKAIGRPDEAVTVTSLAQVDPTEVDMRTLVIIGSTQTRLIERGEGTPWVYSPRGWAG